MNSNILIAEEYAKIRLKLKENGTPIPENDIWIAAICKVNAILLATNDKHFNKIEGLRILKVS